MLSSVLRRTAFCIPCSCSTVRIAAAPSTALSSTHPADKFPMVASPACKAHSQLATYPSKVTTTGILAIQVLLLSITPVFCEEAVGVAPPQPPVGVYRRSLKRVQLARALCQQEPIPSLFFASPVPVVLRSLPQCICERI